MQSVPRKPKTPGRSGTNSRTSRGTRWRLSRSLRLTEADAHLPLHERVYCRIRALILSGELPNGAKLLSSRALAVSLGISRNSVLMALDRLIADGWLEGRRGSGVYVVYQGAHAAGTALQDPEFRNYIPFGIAGTAVDLFPIATWKRLQARRWRDAERMGLWKPESFGSTALRSAIAAHLATVRGLGCSAEQVIATTSTRMGLELAVRALNLAGTQGWVEDPSFYGVRQRLDYSGVRPVAVPVDTEGIDISRGHMMAPEAKFALVTPACQYPTCVVMSDKRRQELVAWARGNNAWIFEDDYDWESHVDQPAPVPIAAHDNARTVFFGSFHKAMFPALRVAYVVVPKDAIAAFTAACDMLQAHPMSANQFVLTDFIEGGYLESHLSKLKNAFLERRAALRAALQNELAEYLAAQPHQAGFHIVCDLRTHREDEIVARRAEANVSIAALSRFRHTPSPLQQVALGFAPFTPSAMNVAAKRLRAMLSK